MLRIFISHYIKNLIRNTRFDANFVFKILISISIIYFCSVIFLFGANFREIINTIKPGQDPVKFYNGILFYLFSIDFLLRFFLQKNRFHLAAIYMSLPVKRRKIIIYILVAVIFNIFNFFQVLFLLPFAWMNILPEYGWLIFILYLIAFLSILVFLSYFTFIIKNLYYDHFIFLLVPVLWFCIVLIIKFILKAEPELTTAAFFSDILSGKFPLVILLVSVAVLITFLTILVIKRSWYNVPVDRVSHKPILRRTGESLLRRSCNFYFSLELSLLLRNKRIRSIFVLPVYIIFLTYVVYSSKPINDNYMLFFWYVCLSGVWGYSYLQFTFSLESSFFDFLLTSNFDFVKYMRVKYLLIIAISFLSIVFVVPLIILDNYDMHTILSALLYNIGIGYFLTLGAATFRRERMDLNRSVFFNYQGNNPVNILVMSIAMLLPLIVLAVLRTFMNKTNALFILNAASILSLLNYNRWFVLIYGNLLKRKYIDLKSRA